MLRTAVVEGQRSAAAAALGISLGVLTWGLAASLGIGAIAAASPAAYGWIETAGAAYLLWLGAVMVRGARQRAAVQDVEAKAGNRWLLRGLLTNLLNPKVGLFYVSFLPQFIPPGVNATAFGMLLAGIHVTMGLVWFCVIIASTRSFATTLSRPQTKRILDTVTGSALVFFGARVLASRAL